MPKTTASLTAPGTHRRLVRGIFFDSGGYQTGDGRVLVKDLSDGRMVYVDDIGHEHLIEVGVSDYGGPEWRADCLNSAGGWFMPDVAN